MTPLEYSYRYIEHKRNGYRGAQYADRQLANSVRLSTYEEQLSWPSPRHRKAIIGICLIAIALFLALDVGAFDDIYIWLSR